MSNELPPGQTRILTFFADAEDQGRQPSRAEVAETLGYAFPSAVSKHVDALVRKGLLQADRDKKRNVRLTDIGWGAIERTPGHRGVPILGAIAAGTPILASENLNGFIEDLQPSPGRFALRVRGDSMIDAGILDGDFAVIERGQPVGEGKIGAVRVGDEATLKRVHYYSDRLELIAENKAYAPRIIPTAMAETEGVEVIGPLICVYRTVA
jgi:repressor LexA